MIATLQLRHYGAPVYRPELVLPIKNCDWVKPTGGLWTSPVNSDYDWFDWCTCEEFRIRALESYFDVEFTGEVAKIDNLEDFLELPYRRGLLMQCPDFEAMVAQGIDAIWLTAAGEEATRFSQPRHLYGWDCETVLVMNKECIK